MEPATAGDSILQATLSPVITGLDHDLRFPLGFTPQALRLRLLSQAGQLFRGLSQVGLTFCAKPHGFISTSLRDQFFTP